MGGITSTRAKKREQKVPLVEGAPSQILPNRHLQNINTTKTKAKRFLRAEWNKPCDGSDIKSIPSGVLELGNLRKAICDIDHLNFSEALRRIECQAYTKTDKIVKEFNNDMHKIKAEIIRLRILIRNVERLESIHDMFLAIDFDKDGTLSQGEFDEFVRCWHSKKRDKRHIKRKEIYDNGIQDAQRHAQDFFHRADVDYNHKLDFNEFVTFVMTLFHAVFDKVHMNTKDAKPEFASKIEINKLLLRLYSEIIKDESKRAHLVRKQSAVLDRVRSKMVHRELFLDFLGHIFQEKYTLRVFEQLMTVSLSSGEWKRASEEAETSIEKVLETTEAIEDADYAVSSGILARADFSKQLALGKTVQTRKSCENFVPLSSGELV